jgi:hypothetical protein
MVNKKSGAKIDFLGTFEHHEKRNMRIIHTVHDFCMQQQT